MTLTSQISKLSFLQSDDPVSLEKVRWSIRQRMRKQMSQLTTDLFDAADDFLFSSGQKGQFGDGSTYLGAMRELRAKQKLFEDRFLDEVTQAIKDSYRRGKTTGSSAAQSGRSDSEVVLEQVELDLAMQAMERKAAKTYLPFIKQIASLQKRREASEAGLVFPNNILTRAALDAFARAHSVLALPLDVRLVFIKLFEQHFLLKMEKIFLDIISIINNADDKAFVDKLYASSSAIAKRRTGEQETADSAPENEKTMIASASETQAIERTVDQLLDDALSSLPLPEIVSEIANDFWRSVLLLVGVNKGRDSREWQEARHGLALLVSAVTDKALASDADREALVAQLRQGFDLIQMPVSQQQDLLDALKRCLKQTSISQSESEQPTGLTSSRMDSQIDSRLEVSISPKGEQILDQDDLDDLAQLLGASATEEPAQMAQQELSDLLPIIDALAEESTVQVLINGKFKDCELQRNISNPSLYTLCTSDGSFCLNRSRLGLAIALREGELRLNEQAMSYTLDARTIIDTSNQTRH